MKLHELKSYPGATHRRKEVGRGPGSGHGKTSGRGEKGQKARSGASISATFEGGQTPLWKRVPRKGFRKGYNLQKYITKYAIVNVSDLNRFEDGTEVTPELLLQNRLVNKELSGIKILGSGELTKKLTVKANVFTNSAIGKIESVGGKAEVI